jgi:hypothetical protein
MDLYDAFTDYISVFPNGNLDTIKLSLKISSPIEIAQLYICITISNDISNLYYQNDKNKSILVELWNILNTEIKYRVSIDENTSRLSNKAKEFIPLSKKILKPRNNN